MNLAAYDLMEPSLDNNSYIIPKYKRLYSSVIEYHRYYCFLYKHDNKSNSTDYFIALFDNEDKDSICRSTTLKGRTVKLDLFPIWEDLELNKLRKTTIVTMEEVNRQDDGVIYRLSV